MKLSIRKGVFETNSSSTHSLTMCSEDTFKVILEENIKKYTDGKEIIKVIVVPKRIVSIVIK